ncbi:MAG: glycosyltransferase family 39 protein [Lachnospiraceae bacterium]|nr:glycosyltransferase family 39 protein [Lachnospiraceae bacterium]
MKALKEKLPLILATAGLLVYLTLIFNNNVWMDEAFTALLVRGSFASMMERSLADTLPPLYNIWAWTFAKLFGFHTLTLKLSSVIPMIALLYYSAVRVAHLYNKNTASCFVLTLVCMPHLLSCAVEIRMYAFCLSFVTMAVISALYLLNLPSKKDLVLFGIFTLLAGYSHHYGLISLLFVWAALLIYFIRKKEGLKSFIICAFITAVLFIPYIIITLYQIKNASAYFSAPSGPSLASFVSSLRFPFVTNITPLSALLLLAVISVMIFGNRKKEGRALTGLYASVLCLSYLLMLISGRSFFSGRYLIPSFGALWLGFSILLFSDRLHLPGKLPEAACVLILLILVVSGIVDFAGAFRDEYSGDVKEMLAFFDENLEKDDGYIIYEDEYQIEWCLKYYEPDLKKYDPEKMENIRGKIWCFITPKYAWMLDEMPVKAYNKDYKGELSFDRYRFSVYLLERQDDRR